MGQPTRRIPFREVISVQIHVVLPGETLSSIGRQYGLPPGLIARYNGLEDASRLAVGQSLLILFPAQTYTVQPGDTLFSAANLLGVTALQLLRDNPNLGGLPALYPGQVLVAGFDDVRTRSVEVTGYAYPFADTSVLRGILPYASALIPFTYGIAADGGVVPLEDETLIALAQQYGVRPLMHLSTLTEDGSFSSARASAVLRSAEARRQLADAVISAMLAKGYEGLDVDFEYVDPEDAALYASFLGQLRQRVNTLGYGLTAALAPKTYAEQPGALYQGHNYALIGQNADVLLLMTYEWGYTYCHHSYMSHKPRTPPGFSGTARGDGLQLSLDEIRTNTRATGKPVALVLVLRARHYAPFSSQYRAINRLISVVGVVPFFTQAARNCAKTSGFRSSENRT